MSYKIRRSGVKGGPRIWAPKGHKRAKSGRRRVLKPGRFFR